MLSIALTIALGCIGLALVFNCWRLIHGPSLPDRILALDTMAINTIALLVTVGIQQNLTAFFEAALLIAMMGFVGTVALCKYLLRGDIIE
jgi:multicomponent K+:H+ antiporter subunit F